jgi:SAM-dependent methyltransferase
VALARAALAGRKNTRLRCGRCETARFAAGAFDRVICFRVLPHFAGIDPVFARFARWLRPGGRLHIVHWNGRAGLAALHAKFEEVAADVLPPAAELAAALQRHNFAVSAWIDNEAEVYIEAVREERLAGARGKDAGRPAPSIELRGFRRPRRLNRWCRVPAYRQARGKR